MAKKHHILKNADNTLAAAVRATLTPEGRPQIQMARVTAELPQDGDDLKLLCEDLDDDDFGAQMHAGDVGIEELMASLGIDGVGDGPGKAPANDLGDPKFIEFLTAIQRGDEETAVALLHEHDLITGDNDGANEQVERGGVENLIADQKADAGIDA